MKILEQTAAQYLATLSLQPEEPLAGRQRNDLPSLSQAQKLNTWPLLPL